MGCRHRSALESLLGESEGALVADGARGEVIWPGRISDDTEGELTARNHGARRAGQKLVADVWAPADVSEQAVNRADDERLRATLAALPDAQHEVIILAFYGELTHTEIATRLGLPAGTVKRRMRLGLHQLKASLKQAAG